MTKTLEERVQRLEELAVLQHTSDSISDSIYLNQIVKEIATDHEEQQRAQS
jgi:hypothetical protein